MNLKYEVGQEVTIEVPKTIAEIKTSEIKTSEIKSITVCKTGAKYLTSDGAFSEEQLNAFAKLAHPQQEDKPTPKYKVGDKVRVVDNTCSHGYPVGEILTLDRQVVRLGHPAWYVEGGHFYIREDDLEPYTEPEQEPIKLYCTESYESGVWITKGKIYEIDDDGNIHFDDGYSCNFNAVPRPSYMTDPLFPLVKREAKKDEWVYIKANALDVEKKYIGTICKVVDSFSYGDIFVETPDSKRNMALFGNEYLVLDGYAPEPKYYNGEVVCTESGRCFTVGKVYEFVDGKIKDNDGYLRPLTDDKISDLADDYMRNWKNKFVPYKGKANADK